MSRSSKKHSSGFHEEYDTGAMDGESSSASEDRQYSTRRMHQKVEPSLLPIVTISIEDSDDELDNNNEESSPDRHRRGFEGEEQLRDSNETTKRQDTDDSDNEVVEVSDEIENISKIVSNGNNILEVKNFDFLNT